MEKVQEDLKLWTSIKTSLPERGTKVSVRLEDGDICSAFLFHNDWFSNEKGTLDCVGDPTYKNKVTHWKKI